jgi:hypothetical protein
MPRWNDALLDPMRLTMDPLADAAVESVFRSSDVEGVNALMRTLVGNNDLVPEELPGELRDFLYQASVLPSWADKARVHAGQLLFHRYGWIIVSILHCGSLPACYALAKGAEVLYRTQRLGKYPLRRVLETAQFVLDAMDPGSLDPANATGRGIRTAQKVRLLHAAVRYHIQRHGWDASVYGQPINQEDLAVTLLTFSVLITDCLQKLGVTLTREEKDAYIHAWNVTGHFMGLREELIADGEEASDELFKVIKRRHYRASDAGKWLTSSLVEYMEEVIPGKLFDNFPSMLIRFFLSDPVGDLLDVKTPNWTRYLTGPLRAVCRLSDALGDSNKEVAKSMSWLGRHLTWALYFAVREGRPLHFRIPQTLRDSPMYGFDDLPGTPASPAGTPRRGAASIRRRTAAV